MINDELKKYELRASLEKAEAGDLQGMYDFLSYMYQTGMEVEANDNDIKERMVRYARNLMDANEPSGYYYMATFLEGGDIVPKDTEKAIELYIKAAEIGAEFCYDYAGCLYYEGDGIEKDYARAFELFAKRENEHQPEAMYVLGDMYRLGLGTEKNCDQAVVHYMLSIMGFMNILEMGEDLTDKQDENARKMLARARYRVAEFFVSGETELGERLSEAEDLLSDAWDMVADEKDDSELFEVTKDMIYRKLIEVRMSL